MGGAVVAGPRGKRKVWTLSVTSITLADFTVAPLAGDGAGADGRTSP